MHAIAIDPLAQGQTLAEEHFLKSSVRSVLLVFTPLAVHYQPQAEVNSAQWQTFAEEHLLKISVRGTRMLNIHLEFSTMPLKCKSTLRTGQCYNLLYY